MKAELLNGTGALGVRLSLSDGTEDVVAFRTGAEAGTVSCGGLESDAQVFAQARSKDGSVKRRLTYGGKKDR